MRGRPAIFNNDVVIEKAQRIFWEKGYAATSLADLLDATGMGSGSFYNTFKGGKKELFRKALQQRRIDFNIFKDQLKVSQHPVSLIKEFFMDIAITDINEHFKGCIIANTVIETAFLDKELQNEAIDILKEVEIMYTDAIRREQLNGSLKNSTDAAVLGRYLITLWNGINVTRRMYPHTDILKEQICLQLRIIN